GAAPYGAPQLPVTHALNVNENPFGPSRQLADHIGRAVRYRPSSSRSARASRSGYLAFESGITVPRPESVWAANGSNEIMHQLLLAFGGPGRTALGFSPHYSMY